MKCYFYLALFASFFSLTVCFAQRSIDTKEADDLVAYANRLALRGYAVKIGDDGLTINGQTLSGEAVRRPSDALARAAELYAEYAAEERNTRMMSTALRLWKRIARPEFAIPYLRLYSKNARDSRDPFALFCHVQLADIYEQIGDFQSADDIYSQYIDFDPTDVLEVYATAAAAQRLLALNRVDEATELAQKSVIACDPSIFSQEPGGEGYTMAINVLQRIPGATIPSIQTTADQASAKIRQDIQLQTNNPRRLINEGNLAFRVGDFPAAIEKWKQYQQSFPNEDQARQISIRIAQAYEKLKQMDKALETYEFIEGRYPEFAEWYQAILGKALILETGGKPQEAEKFLQSSLKKATTAESSAQITLALAEFYMRRNNADEAVSHYLNLMTNYADQDASRQALANLLKAAPRSKDWKRLATGVRDWFSQNLSLGSRSETKNLSVSDASRIRRLVLSFYAKNDDVKSGVRWLTEMRRISDQTHQEFLNRDEAWLYAQGALTTAQKMTKSTNARIFSENVAFGIAAWDLAPNTEEGLSGLKAAHLLSTGRFSPVRANRILEEKLKAMLAFDETKDDAHAMLVSYYNFLGDQKSVDNLLKSEAK